MALRWAGAAMQEAAKGFRRLKAHKQLPLLKAALAERKARAPSANRHLAQALKAAWPLTPRRPLLDFQQEAGYHRTVTLFYSRVNSNSNFKLGFRVFAMLVASGPAISARERIKGPDDGGFTVCEKELGRQSKQ